MNRCLNCGKPAPLLVCEDCLEEFLLTQGLWWDNHRIMAIEYHGRRPFSVTTLERWDHSGKPWFKPGVDLPRGWCNQHWDYEYSRSNRELYRHNSGGGGAIDLAYPLSRFCKPDPPPGELWVDPLLTLVTWVRDREYRPLEPGELLRMGYRQLKQPRLVVLGRERSRNPFEISEEGECSYCAVCDDWYPTEWNNQPCDHLFWCDECGDFRYDQKYARVDPSDVCPGHKEEDEEHG